MVMHVHGLERRNGEPHGEFRVREARLARQIKIDEAREYLSREGRGSEGAM